MWSARLTLVVVALTVAAFPAAIADLVLVSPANPHPSRGLAVGMIVIAALLAVPSIVTSLLVRRRRGEDWLAPILALTGFLPALALLGTVFQEGRCGDLRVECDHVLDPVLEDLQPEEVIRHVGARIPPNESAGSRVLVGLFHARARISDRVELGKGG